MAQVTTDKAHHGIPMTPEELAEYEQTWKDVNESIEYCYKHPVKLKK